MAIKNIKQRIIYKINILKEEFLVKILGENSLSSKTENGLRILFLIITVLVIITLGINSVMFFSDFNSYSIRENYLFKTILEGIVGFVFITTGIVALFIIKQFIKIFKNLEENRLFEKENSKYLSNVSKLSIVIGILYLICLIGISIFIGSYGSFDLLNEVLIKILIFVFAIVFLIFGIGIKILNEIYKEAIKYKEENDFTI